MVFTVRRLIVLIDWFWIFVLGEFEKEQLTKGPSGWSHQSAAQNRDKIIMCGNDKEYFKIKIQNEASGCVVWIVFMTVVPKIR